MRDKYGRFIKGHPVPERWAKKFSELYRGKTLPEETRKRMSASRKGKPQLWHKGIPLSPEHRAKIGRAKEKHWNWQGGLSLLNDRHDSNEYKKWRIAVYQRDNFACQFCGVHMVRGNGIKINADHIKSWAKYPELRFDVSNGRTLCIDCHKQTKTYSIHI